MTLPTDYVDGDVLTAADVNAITVAVNSNTSAIGSLTPVFSVESAKGTATIITNSTNYTNTGVSLAYTPTNASNDLIVEATFIGGFLGATGSVELRQAYFQIFDSTNSTVVDQKEVIYDLQSAATDPEIVGVPCTLRNIISASSTTARTYVIRLKSENAGYSAFVSGGASNPVLLSVTEVSL
jgi:hypothetical protein